tara:strand:+ start:669 stop:866 length:198 start_codon:yes stop_codon:yes gene_type:complete
MQLRVIAATDDDYLGSIFDVPFLDLTNIDIPVEDDVVFSIVDHEDLGGGKHRYSNAHYVVICEVV